MNNKKEKKKLNWWQTLLATIASIAIGILAVYIFMEVIVGADKKKTDDMNRNSIIRSQQSQNLVSYEQYEKVKEGMSYEEVCRIFGSNGTNDGEYESFNTKTTSYSWKMTNNKKVYLTFGNNKLTTKAVY